VVKRFGYLNRREAKDLNLNGLINLINEGRCTYYDLEQSSKELPCTEIEIIEGKTLYCFGRKFFNTYKNVVAVDLNNIGNIRLIKYFLKVKINNKNVLYKAKIK
jgi:hypothetical protein